MAKKIWFEGGLRLRDHGEGVSVIRKELKQLRKDNPTQIFKVTKKIKMPFSGIMWELKSRKR